MASYVGEVTVVDHDRLFTGKYRFTVHRTGTGGQTYEVIYDPALLTWRIYNVHSHHTLRPTARIGRSIIGTCRYYLHTAQEEET